jgi:hypothetical protein
MNNQYEWNAALALNNMAITMLSRSCFQQAAETLVDAVLVMPENASSPVKSRQEIAARLANANTRLYNPDLGSSKLNVNLSVIHHNGIVQGWTGYHQSTTTNNGLYYAVHIEAESTEMEYAEAQAIILHNFATVSYSFNTSTSLSIYLSVSVSVYIDSPLLTQNNTFLIIYSAGYVMQRIIFKVLALFLSRIRMHVASSSSIGRSACSRHCTARVVVHPRLGECFPSCPFQGAHWHKHSNRWDT